MDKPLVSVCISTFNRREKLKQCIDSVLNQDYKNIEFVIYDNCSTDGSFEYLSNIAERIIDTYEIRIFYNDTPISNAMVTLNYTFENAEGKYVLVMDDDAYLPEVDTISKLVEVAESDVKIAIVGANVKGVDGEWQMPIRTTDGLFVPTWQIDQMQPFDYYEFHGACALFRTDIFEGIGYYDESFTIYMNEIDMSCRALNYGFRVVFHPGAAAVHYGVGDTNACNKRVYHFVKNYNTVLTRNFRTFFGRLKAVLVHTFMSSGYYAERILIHKTCNSRFKIVSFTWYMLKALIIALYRCAFPDKRYTFEDQKLHDIFEQSMYNGFKRCIHDRMLWFLDRKDTTLKGVR